MTTLDSSPAHSQPSESADPGSGPVSGALASHVRRLAATAIDAVLVPATTILVVLITGATEDAEDYASLPGLALSILGLAILSYLLLNGFGLLTRGQTIGKQLLGIAIVKAEPQADNLWSREPAAFWKLICIRALFFPLLFLLPLWPLSIAALIDQLPIFGKNRRCLHDYLAGTVVINR